MGAKGAAGGLVGAGIGFAVGGPLGAVALGSAGFGAGESLDAADKSVNAAKANKALIAAQAAEVERRAEWNRQQIMAEEQTNRGDQIGATVAGGVDVSSQSSLLAMESAHARFQQQAYFQQRDAQMQANSMRAQAQNQVDAAKRGRTAAQIGAVTSVLGTGVAMGSQAFKAASGAPAGTFQGGGAVDVTGNY